MDNSGVPASPSGSHASHDAVPSSPSVSIPNAGLTLRTRRILQWPTVAGDVVLTFPDDLTTKDIDALHSVFAIAEGVMRSRAQAIETQRAKTEGLGPEDESAVTK